jgi:hypothetical protein
MSVGTPWRPGADRQQSRDRRCLRKDYTSPRPAGCHSPHIEDPSDGSASMMASLWEASKSEHCVLLRGFRLQRVVTASQSWRWLHGWLAHLLVALDPTGPTSPAPSEAFCALLLGCWHRARLSPDSLGGRVLSAWVWFDVGGRIWPIALTCCGGAEEESSRARRVREEKRSYARHGAGKRRSRAKRGKAEPVCTDGDWFALNFSSRSPSTRHVPGCDPN